MDDQSKMAQPGPPIDLSGCVKLSECEDVEFLRKAVAFLWGVLDDIDSLNDMAKNDDKLYRQASALFQSYRWRTGIVTDGYGLYVRKDD